MGKMKQYILTLEIQNSSLLLIADCFYAIVHILIDIIVNSDLTRASEVIDSNRRATMPIESKVSTNAICYQTSLKIRTATSVITTRE